MSQNNITKSTKGGSSHVRMSLSEYNKIKKDSETLGKSIPELLRKSYFDKPSTKVLVNKDDLSILRKDLSKIGNNLNQIAKRINSGLTYGWSDTLDLILEQFKTLTLQIHYDYGIPKN